MISFEDIDKHSWLYDLYMMYLCVAHNFMYYRKFHILNPENIPPKGTPTMVIANHQNGMMDAMAILHTLYKDGRQPVFVARGDIFKNDLVAKALRGLKIMPVYRQNDGSRADIKKDLLIFNLAAGILQRGGTMVLFPEAGHHQGHYLISFKKGFSRIAFAAEELSDFQLGLQILPVNIHYSNYFDFQSDLMVTCGKPFTFEEFFETYKMSPNQAYLALNDKARERVKELTPDIDIPDYYDEIESLTQIVNEPILNRKELDTNYLPNRKDVDMAVIDAVRHLKDERPDDFQSLMDDTRQYTTLLQQTGLRHWAINRHVSGSKLTLCIFSMVLTLPLFLFGYVNNFLPSFITRKLTSKVEDPMMHSTFQYGLGSMVTFPIWYIFLLVLVSVLTHHFWMGLVYIVLSAVAGYFSFYYRKVAGKLLALFKAFRLRSTEAYQKLCHLNTRIIAKVEELVL